MRRTLRQRPPGLSQAECWKERLNLEILRGTDREVDLAHPGHLLLTSQSRNLPDREKPQLVAEFTQPGVVSQKELDWRRCASHGCAVFLCTCDSVPGTWSHESGVARAGLGPQPEPQCEGPDSEEALFSSCRRSRTTRPGTGRPPSVFATLVHVSSEKCLTPERLPGFWRSRKQALHTLQCLLVCNGTKRQR